MSGRDSGIVKIHGRDYKTVAKRVDEFRKEHGDKYAIITQMVANDERSVVMMAEILNEKRDIIATGYAEERRNSSDVNRTSAVENCETSAIGRALANFGYGGGEYASADEVANKLRQQGANKAPQKALPPANKWETYLVDFEALEVKLSGLATIEDVDQYAKDFAVEHPKLTEKQKEQVKAKFANRREQLQ